MFSYFCIMDLQLVLVLLLFFIALFYIGRLIYRNVSSNRGCASNCGKCSADFSNIKLPEVKS
ncbi:MAG: FeoB-associated Cys-rich membrane protein [Daejeonella sp.]